MQERVDILVVGNELLNGTTLDTNSFWLSKELTKLGYRVDQKLTVRDDLRIISLALKQCICRKPDWIFSVGGLGPTFDDMTLHALALSIGKRLKPDPDAVSMLRDSYRRRAGAAKASVIRLTKSRMKMANIPLGAKPLRNPVGSAPAVLTKLGNTRIVSLPGVPAEMKSIFSKEVVPLLNRESTFVIAEEWIRIVGVSESKLSPVIFRVLTKFKPLLYIKSHPRGFQNGVPVIQIQLILTTAANAKKAGLERLLDATRQMELAARKLGARVSRLKSIR
jgi:nicotinamide-nucleotide amidase